MTVDRTNDGSDKRTERASPIDRIGEKEAIGSKRQNRQFKDAVESNPDKCESVADLRVPNRDQIEPFQLVDGGKTIAASRKQETKVSESKDSYFQGLKALNVPEGVSQEEKDRLQVEWSIKYIEDKATRVSDPNGDEIAFDFKRAGQMFQKFGRVTEAQIENPELRKVEGGSDLLRPRRGREDDFVSLGACRAATNRFEPLRMRTGLGPGHIDPDLIAATIRNEQHHFKQLYDTGTDNYVQNTDKPDALDDMQSIGPAQMQIRNIKHLMQRYGEELAPFKTDPLKAATRPGDAPYFVAAYFANVVEGLESNERPNFITEKTWGKVSKLFKEGKVNDALIYSYNPDPEQVKHINEQLSEIWKQRMQKKD